MEILWEKHTIDKFLDSLHYIYIYICIYIHTYLFDSIDMVTQKKNRKVMYHYFCMFYPFYGFGGSYIQNFASDVMSKSV